MSFFVTYMCHFIKPDSVDSYLSGICNQLEDVFPNVRKVRASALVRRTLKGSKHLFGKGAKRKHPLSTSDLRTVVRAIGSQPRPSHDDMLFLVMMFTGFDGLMRLGELAWPDTIALRNWRKVILRNTVKLTQSSVGFFLPGHKADIFFEGNQIVIVARADPELNTVTKVEQYLASRDALFPHHPALFVREDGSIPTRSWFLGRLCKYFDRDIAGHSLRAGGATSLAEAGVAPEKIQAIGRWASNTFQIYMWKNPTLLQSMLFAGRSAHDGPRHIGALAFPTAPP
jgi:integrase